MALNLYYDSKKGLVKAQNYAVGNYIMEHDEKGWDAPHHEQVLEIPDRNVKITVNTNLGWGPKSFMNARISMMDKNVLNFLDTTLRYPVDKVCVKPGDWKELFDGIINLYNSIYNSEAPINSFFDMVEETIKATDCTIEKMVFVTTRLSELSEMLPDSVYADSRIIEKRMRNACCILFQNIEEKCDRVSISDGQGSSLRKVIRYGKSIMSDEQQNRIESNLQSILKYLAERNAILYVFARKGQCVVGNHK